MRRFAGPSSRLFVCGLFAVSLFLMSTLTTQAQDANSAATPAASPVAPIKLPSFGIYPKDTGPGTFFNVMQEAGTTKAYTVVMINGGDASNGPFKGRAYAANVTIRPNGGLNSGNPTEAPTGATAWLDYPTEIYTIDPGKGIERTFNVTIPKDVKPGQYIAALSFETADPIEIPNTPALKQNLRQTIAFEITVPGKVEASFQIKDVHVIADPEWTGLLATISNTGNVLVKPSGTITISDVNGNPLGSLPLSLGTYYAFKDGLIQIGIGSLTPNGVYLVTIDLHDADSGASASIENQKVEVTTSAAIAAANAPPIGFDSATGTLRPSPDKPQFLDVAATVTNTGDPVTGAELDISAYKDGKLVETYVLVSPLALAKGSTNVTSRYIPATGWTKGAWSFKLSVQVRDAKTGVATILNTVSLGNPVNVP